ncbi:hypothetical protein NUSPORA_01454 [Nucleospora cyclopteri]
MFTYLIYKYRLMTSENELIKKSEYSIYLNGKISLSFVYCYFNFLNGNFIILICLLII